MGLGTQVRDEDVFDCGVGFVRLVQVLRAAVRVLVHFVDLDQLVQLFPQSAVLHVTRIELDDFLLDLHVFGDASGCL